MSNLVWQPIETAPRDGTVIDVWDEWHGCRVANVSWVGDMWLAVDSPTPDNANITYWAPLLKAPNTERTESTGKYLGKLRRAAKVLLGV